MICGPTDPVGCENKAIVQLAGPVAQDRHRPVSQREWTREWEEGDAWPSAREQTYSALMVLQ
jgi:hypothetical protein